MAKSSLGGYVYLITNVVNGMTYVGCTRVSIKRRWQAHVSVAKTQGQGSFVLHAAIRKYGKCNFRVECLEEVGGSHADLMAAEIRHIAAYKCVAPLGYNLTSGGDGFDFSDPLIRERHAETMRKRALNPEWQKKHADAVNRNVNNPEWQRNIAAANQKKASDPQWLKNVTEADKKRRLDPVWQAKQAEGVRRMASDPVWQRNVAEANRKRLATPEGRESQAIKVVKMRAAHIAKAIARAALLPVEEQERRARKRESDRLRYLAKKAGASHDVV